MLILALDTTTRIGSVAIVRAGVVIYERQGDGVRTHAERLPSDVATTCREAEIDIAEVEAFAVAAGPGSFTGLRVGIATIQGLAMAHGRLAVPVPTLEAIAAAAPGDTRRIATWLDAQRGEVFAQVFERTVAGSSPLVDAVSAPPARVLAVHASMLEAAAFHGDGAIRYHGHIRAAIGPAARIADRLPPLAAAIGLIAARHPERAVLPHAIEPIYVRRSDAEIARDRRDA